MVKKTLSLILALVMVLGTFSFVYAEGEAVTAETPAETTTEQAGLDAKIQWLKDQNLVSGYADGSLGLEKPITRAEMAAMIVRGQGLEEQANAAKGTPTKFKDVPATHWASGYINIATGAGFVNGFPNGTFKPSDNIKYQDVIVMLTIANANHIAGMTNPQTGAVLKQAYPFGYIKLAADAEMLDNVGITNYAAAGIRENVFKLVYNSMNNVADGNFGRNVAFKAIVARNSRTEQLEDKEVIFRIVAVPGADRDATNKATSLQRKTYNAGDLIKFELPEKYGDPDMVLGKVYDVSLDKDGKITNLALDKTYEVKYGKVTFADVDKLGLDGRNYTVQYRRNYSNAEDRIVDTFVNNRDFNYAVGFRNFARDCSFARATVKNGMVFFIDGYRFNDIAPFKELDSRKEYLRVYDDAQDGRVSAFEITKSMLGYTKEKGLYRITPEQIKDTDVIHRYPETDPANINWNNSRPWKQVGYIVRQDAKFDGTYDRVVRNQDGDRLARVKVADKDVDFFMSQLVNPPFKAVYAYDAKNFRRLDRANDQNALRNFNNMPVTVLEDVLGNMQSIYGTVAFNQEMALVDNVIADRGRFVNTTNTATNLNADLDTRIRAYDIIDRNRSAKIISHRSLNNLDRGDLVYTDAPDAKRLEQLVRLQKFDDIQRLAVPVATTGSGAWNMNNDTITRTVQDGNGTTKYQVLGRTNVFIMNPDTDRIVARIAPADLAANQDSRICRIDRVIGATTVNKAKSMVDKLGDGNKMSAYIITDADFLRAVDDRIIRYYDSFNVGRRNNVAHTIIFVNFADATDYVSTDILVTRLDTAYYGKHVATDQDGREYLSDKDLSKVNEGDVINVEYTEDKDSKRTIKSFTKKSDINNSVRFKVTDENIRNVNFEGRITLKYGATTKECWVKRNVQVFTYPAKHDPIAKVGDVVRVVVDDITTATPMVSLIVVDTDERGSTPDELFTANVKVLIRQLRKITKIDADNVKSTKKLLRTAKSFSTANEPDDANITDEIIRVNNLVEAYDKTAPTSDVKKEFNKKMDAAKEYSPRNIITKEDAKDALEAYNNAREAYNNLSKEDKKDAEEDKELLVAIGEKIKKVDPSLTVLPIDGTTPTESAEAKAFHVAYDKVVLIAGKITKDNVVEVEKEWNAAIVAFNKMTADERVAHAKENIKLAAIKAEIDKVKGDTPATEVKVEAMSILNPINEKWGLQVKLAPADAKITKATINDTDVKVLAADAEGWINLEWNNKVEPTKLVIEVELKGAKSTHTPKITKQGEEPKPEPELATAVGVKKDNGSLGWAVAVKIEPATAKPIKFIIDEKDVTGEINKKGLFAVNVELTAEPMEVKVVVNNGGVEQIITAVLTSK